MSIINNILSNNTKDMLCDGNYYMFIYFNVRYEDKDFAKSQGMMWNKHKKLWYYLITVNICFVDGHFSIYGIINNNSKLFKLLKSRFRFMFIDFFNNQLKY